MTTVIDTPEGIERYRIQATYRGLQMEILMQEKYGLPPTACPTQGQALASARRLVHEYGLEGKTYTRKQALKTLWPLVCT